MSFGGEENGGGSNPDSRNGSITGSLDESLLVDPRLLFIGSKVGEGAHGKVYEGRLVKLKREFLVLFLMILLLLLILMIFCC